ncbi:MAG: hypothetical protein COU69_00830 [Candidatus Pacebacteria bacterium CG10_big_fil_rev_8_21_14_0_10_56_10]|nr:MAG: hypothetical protein COU69_00830 [Candidatus Pacebacteria bacterium CG10_big_fil_rev_8_21_14_0_10_56_10]
MNKISQFQRQAIQAAKRLDWQAAVEHNSALLNYDPANVGALNRQGVAYFQLGMLSKARHSFKQVLDIDKSNPIARKQLDKIKQKKPATVSFSREHFIEEPGKTKIVELHRLASKAVLESVAVGDLCQLVPKSRYISVESSNSTYLGALPEDLSFRLTKLMKRRNSYSCFIHSADGKCCSVYLKETFRSKRNENINSFPLNRVNLAAINDVDERFLLEDDVPLTIVNTDTDAEKTLKDVSSDNDD